MNESAGTSQDSTSVITEPVPDLQLQLLIQLLDRELRSSLPITLNVPSGVLYGDIIGHEAWKSEWARSVRQAAGDAANLIAEFPETVDQGIKELRAEDDSQLPRWIHLRNATLVVGAVNSVSMPLWRGRLADVSGWGLGQPQ
ncbi:hypothetical protein [Streptomyces sp. NPDC058620]|uniref:hypothetical protein n=1 Tax=Streptomyces sp. NPDC058620 TaxID=3346560 RepID=UPI003655CBDA